MATPNARRIMAATGDGYDTAEASLPVVLVAASDAPATVRALADYVCDGTADEVEINAAIAANTVVQLSAGSFVVADSIDIPQAAANLTLRGAGKGATVISGAIDGVAYVKSSGTSGASRLVGLTLEDFEIDGSAQTTTGGYTASAKGVFCQYVRRATYRRLYVHDCAATGIAPDYPDDVLVVDCTATGNGRLNDGTEPGGNGIGIATFGDQGDVEPVVVLACAAYDNTNYGIFAEQQSSGSGDKVSGVKIVGCHAQGNDVGIADSGNRRALIAHNTCTGNLRAGIAVDNGTLDSSPRTGREAIVVGNACWDNFTGANAANATDGVGILVASTDADSNSDCRTHVAHNRCSVNGTNGIKVVVDTVDVVHVHLIDNDVHDNYDAGILVDYLDGGSTADFAYGAISRNRVWSNGRRAGATFRDGIYLDAPCVDVEVDGNRAFDRLTAQQYGLTVAQPFAGGTIRGNDVRNNVAGTARLTGSGALDADVALSGNLGVAAAFLGTVREVYEFLIDGGGSTITTGVKGDLHLPHGGTIVGWTLLADQTGSAVLDLWKDSRANHPPTVADTITASDKPTLSSAAQAEDLVPTGWTTTVAAGDVVRVNVDSATTVQRLTLALHVDRPLL